MRLALGLLCLAAAFSSASAGGIDACEKIKDADAYNACLASHGPAVGAHQFTAAPPPVAGKTGSAPRRRARAAAKPVKAGPKRQANGRVRIEIFPGR